MEPKPLAGCFHLLCPPRQGARSWSAYSNQREGGAKTRREDKGGKKWNICWPRDEHTRTEGPEVPVHLLSTILSMGCQLLGRLSRPAMLSAGVSRSH